ncbi:hypothetical protein AHAS_Ahas06G0178600 [Arachis hypogaea]
MLLEESKDRRTFQEEVKTIMQNRWGAIKKLEAQVGYLSKQITTHNSLSDTMANPREESKEQEKEETIPSEIHMKEEEVVRIYKPKAPYPQRLLVGTKEHANSLPKDSMQHHVEEREEVNQGSPHSNETESCIKEDGDQEKKDNIHEEEKVNQKPSHPYPNKQVYTS